MAAYVPEHADKRAGIEEARVGGIAARACFHESMKKASPIAWEPIVDVDAAAPVDRGSDAAGGFNSAAA